MSKDNETLQEYLPEGAEVAEPMVLPEVRSALPDDIRLLRAVLAAVWRPHG